MTSPPPIEQSTDFDITKDLDFRTDVPCALSDNCRDFFCEKNHNDFRRPRNCEDDRKSLTFAEQQKKDAFSPSAFEAFSKRNCRNPGCHFVHATIRLPDVDHATGEPLIYSIQSNLFTQCTLGKYNYFRGLLNVSKAAIDEMKDIVVCTDFYNTTPGKCARGQACPKLHLLPDWRPTPEQTIRENQQQQQQQHQPSISTAQYYQETLERNKKWYDEKTTRGISASPSRKLSAPPPRADNEKETNNNSNNNNSKEAEPEPEINCLICFSDAVRFVVTRLNDDDDDEDEEDMDDQEHNGVRFKGLFCNATISLSDLSKRHFICPRCLSNDIVNRWAEIEHEPGKIPDYTCQHPDCKNLPPSKTSFNESQIVKTCSLSAGRKFLEVRQKAKDAITYGQAQEEARKAIKEKNDKIILAKQLAMQLGDKALQCPKCAFGPITFADCADLKAHHGEMRQGVRVDNSCRHCGYFHSSRSAFRKWDGILRDEKELTAKKDQYRHMSEAVMNERNGSGAPGGGGGGGGGGGAWGPRVGGSAFGGFRTATLHGSNIPIPQASINTVAAVLNIAEVNAINLLANSRGDVQLAIDQYLNNNPFGRGGGGAGGGGATSTNAQQGIRNNAWGQPQAQQQQPPAVTRPNPTPFGGAGAANSGTPFGGRTTAQQQPQPQNRPPPNAFVGGSVQRGTRNTWGQPQQQQQPPVAPQSSPFGGGGGGGGGAASNPFGGQTNAQQQQQQQQNRNVFAAQQQQPAGGTRPNPFGGGGGGTNPQQGARNSAWGNPQQQQQQPPAAPRSNPFGGGGAGGGAATSGANPFGGGSGGAASSSNPFGGQTSARQQQNRSAFVAQQQQQQPTGGTTPNPFGGGTSSNPQQGTGNSAWGPRGNAFQAKINSTQRF